MKVVFVWPGVTAYMTACWRELATRMGSEMNVAAVFQRVTDAPFDETILSGVPHTLIDENRVGDFDYVLSRVQPLKPEVIVVAGWALPSFTRLIDSTLFPDARFVMGMDTPLRGDWRQRAAKFKLKSHVQKMDRVVAAGERAWQYARYLGVPECKARRGMYGIDYASLSPVYEQRLQQPGGWPKKFVYFGRYSEEKGIDDLVAAYRIYRGRVGEAEAWPLTCCGKGADGHLLKGQKGIEDRGFVQPGDQLGVLREHGVFVLASRFDPWPLVVVESCAAGLPVLCTEACGSAVELVRPYFNGLTVARDDPQRLARGMEWMHRHHAELPEMGARGQALAAPYSAQMWATRWMEMFEELRSEEPRA